jgi:hypothetical protein
MTPETLLPAVPVLAAGVLMVLHASMPRRWVEQGASLLVLLTIVALSRTSDACVSLLIGALTAVGALADAVIPGERHRFSQAARQVRLAAILIATLPVNALVIWLALALAAVAGAATRLPRMRTALTHLVPANAALGVALFGAVAFQVHAVPTGSVALLLGWGTLVLLDPALLPLFVLLALQLQGSLAGTVHAALVGNIMIGLGLGGLLLSAAFLLLRPDSTRRPHALTLAQGGIALCAFGIGGPEMRFAGLLHLTLLVLSRCALLLSSDVGADRVASVAGLSGLPPLGVFPSLALILFGTAIGMPWLLVPLVAGLVAIGWTSATHLPQDATRVRRSAAWVPLACALVLGIATPAPVVSWLQAISDSLR